MDYQGFNTSSGAEGAILVGVVSDAEKYEDAESALSELEALCDTAGVKVLAALTQVRRSADPSTVIGSGKLRELYELCENLQAGLVIFDEELSPAQVVHLEKELPKEVRVIDRSVLILDIFANNAHTAEGMLQVEIAQLKYSVPRLTGRGKELSRLGGGIGTRGPGESKLETDKRHVKRRIAALEQKLEALAASRDLRRGARKAGGKKQVTIAGYTNAGKSTLLNTLTNADILARDQLFATLDPTTRKLVLPHKTEVLLTDTVGFIDRLPHHLIEAFASTLDEVAYADLLLVVLDASDPNLERQLSVTRNLVYELGKTRKVLSPKTIFVYNKCDKLSGELILAPQDRQNSVQISAVTGFGIGELLQRMEAVLREDLRLCTLRFALSEESSVDLLYRKASVIDARHDENGVTLHAYLEPALTGRFADHIIG